MEPTLRLEIFPADLDSSISFYELLGFRVLRTDDGPPRYAYLRRGEIRLGMLESPPVESSIRATPVSTEIVIEVDDIVAERDRVVAAGVHLAEDLMARPWGLTDFRVLDPDGFYLRFTDRAKSGTCGFRLMPDDPMDVRPSTGTLTTVAAGHAVALDYSWEHAADGVQHGHLVIGRADEDGRVTASWIDSWHQTPAVALLTGTGQLDPLDVSLAMEYSGWGWRIAVQAGDGLTMTMHNVIPEGVDGAQPGPYLVMDARWPAVG